MQRLVSIITPSYNSKKYIEKTIYSVLQQTYHEWELVIVDDCSDDGSIKIVENFAREDSRIQVIKLPANVGVAEARNAGIRLAKGDYIAFLDSDDLWHPEKLSNQIDFMGDHIDFSFTAYKLINEQGESLRKLVDSKQQGCFNYQDMLKKKATVGCSTVMLRRNAFNDLAMPIMKTGEDYALWLKLLKTGKNAYILADVYTSYRILSRSLSRNKFKTAKRQWKTYREIESLNIFQSLYCFYFYAWRAVFRK